MPFTKLIEKQANRRRQQVFLSEQNLKSFKEAYASCVDDIFEFEGQPVLRSYAEYLLEYYEGVPVSQETSCDRWCWSTDESSTAKQYFQREMDFWGDADTSENDIKAKKRAPSADWSRWWNDIKK